MPIRDWVGVSSGPSARVLGFDQALVWVIVALLALGLVMVYSASVALPDNPRSRAMRRRTSWCATLISVVMAVRGSALLAFQVPMATWEKHALAAVRRPRWLLLLLVLVPHIGKGVNGARRWIPLGLIELPAVASCAKLADRRCTRPTTWCARWTSRRASCAPWLPMAVALGVVGSLLLAEPDMGAFMVIAAIAMGILFLGGVNARMFFLIASPCWPCAFVLMIATSPMARASASSPTSIPGTEKYALGKGYQLTHSLIAFGRGEIFGLGLGGRSRSCTTCPRRTPTSCSR